MVLASTISMNTIQTRKESKMTGLQEWQKLVPQPNIRNIIENNKLYSLKDFRPILHEFKIIGISWAKVNIEYKNITIGEFPSRYANGGKRNKTGLMKSALDRLYSNITGS